MVNSKIRNKIMKLVCDYFSDEKHEIMDSVIIRSNLKLSQETTIHSLKVLESMNYITYEQKTPPHGFIRITQKGKSYFEVKSDELHTFWKRSIITPILVSMTTTLLLNLLLYLLLLIPEWIQSLLHS